MKSSYISKHNSNHEKQILLLKIQNGEEWHYLTVKRSPALLRGITSKHDGDFNCLSLSCLHLVRAKKLESNKDYVKIQIFRECFSNTLKLPKI